MQGNAADRRKRSFLEAKARGGQKSGHGAGNPNRFRVDSISAASAGHSVTNTKLCHPTTGSDHLASCHMLIPGSGHSAAPRMAA